MMTQTKDRSKKKRQMCSAPTIKNAAPSTMPSSKRGQAKRVIFSLRNDVIMIERYEDLKPDYEKVAFWYMNEELIRVWHSIDKTIKMMQETGNACKRCIRGLEYIASPEYFEQVKINRDCVYSAVFREQHRQQMLGINDLEEIRK
eukprot:9109888-Ditylum_brightwellii.AAC.1